MDDTEQILIVSWTTKITVRSGDRHKADNLNGEDREYKTRIFVIASPAERGAAIPLLREIASLTLAMTIFEGNEIIASYQGAVLDSKECDCSDILQKALNRRKGSNKILELAISGQFTLYYLLLLSSPLLARLWRDGRG